MTTCAFDVGDLFWSQGRFEESNSDISTTILEVGSLIGGTYNLETEGKRGLSYFRSLCSTFLGDVSCAFEDDSDDSEDADGCEDEDEAGSVFGASLGAL